jgi:phthiocerol/phenolphthiocerol synthesis type-I polyketide synthase E
VRCSSLSCLLGGPGYRAYAGANAFLDALAESAGGRRRGAGRWISIDWDAWDLGGERRRLAPAAGAALAMTPAEGVEVFRRILAAPGLPRVAVSTAPLELRRAAAGRAEAATRAAAAWRAVEATGAAAAARRAVVATGAAAGDAAAGVAAGVASTVHQRPALDQPYVAPRTETELALAAMWQALLGLDRVGAEDYFFQLGGDSMMAAQVISRVRELFAVDLPLKLILEQPTVIALSRAIELDRSSLGEPVAQAEVER